jgi:hypothetical protein
MAVTSPRGAWAVGWSTTASIHSATLIEQWDGRSWEIVPSPSRGRSPVSVSRAAPFHG